MEARAQTPRQQGSARAPRERATPRRSALSDALRPLPFEFATLADRGACAEPAAASDGTGHRGRLRQRLFEGGPEALLDHELVEYLLGLAIPRRDTKPLAKKLIREFGCFGSLMCADAATIARVGDISEGAAAALKVAHAAALRILKSQVEGQKVLGSWQALLDYLRADMAFEPVERVRVLFLNARNVLIRDEK
ncbi:MAG TPA: hypothetical protein VGX37_10995, partial [Allosphingosinicella sp.]|nr:hypothetical protein [Allosphingosinicella sp.]